MCSFYICIRVLIVPFLKMICLLNQALEEGQEIEELELAKKGRQM